MSFVCSEWKVSTQRKSISRILHFNGIVVPWFLGVIWGHILAGGCRSAEGGDVRGALLQEGRVPRGRVGGIVLFKCCFHHFCWLLENCLRYVLRFGEGGLEGRLLMFVNFGLYFADGSRAASSCFFVEDYGCNNISGFCRCVGTHLSISPSCHMDSIELWMNKGRPTREPTSQFSL